MLKSHIEAADCQHVPFICGQRQARRMFVDPCDERKKLCVFAGGLHLRSNVQANRGRNGIRFSAGLAVCLLEGAHGNEIAVPDVAYVFDSKGKKCFRTARSGHELDLHCARGENLHDCSEISAA